MKNTKQLINNIIGQLNGVSRMIEEDKDCKDVIIQIKAVKSALNSLSMKYIEENALSCFDGGKNATIKNKEKIKLLIKELIKNN